MDDTKINGLFWGFMGMVLAMVFISLIFGSCLIQPYLEYKVKLKMTEVASKAVDKGLELRLNGDLLKGIELIKIDQSK